MFISCHRGFVFPSRPLYNRIQNAVAVVTLATRRWCSSAGSRSSFRRSSRGRETLRPSRSSSSGGSSAGEGQRSVKLQFNVRVNAAWAAALWCLDLTISFLELMGRGAVFITPRCSVHMCDQKVGRIAATGAFVWPRTPPMTRDNSGSEPPTCWWDRGHETGLGGGRSGVALPESSR